MTTLNLPASFRERVINTFGESGEIWLTKLPDLITECEKRFNLKIESSFTRQSFNFTAPARQADGTVVVIKLCVPTSEVDNEIQALKFMRGDGMVRLLESDSQNGILLLEKLNPGEMLSTLHNDSAATSIAANVMQKIWKPVTDTHTTQTTAQWFDRLEQPVELPKDFPISLIDKAKQVALEHHQDMGEAVLLHGDLHHFNILSGKRQPWLAIDPKGVVGEREYEVGALLRNPIPDIVTTMNTKKILTRRVDQLVDLLELDRGKIVAWGFAQAILAAVWCIDSKTDDWRIFLECAKTLFELQ